MYKITSIRIAVEDFSLSTLPNVINMSSATSQTPKYADNADNFYYVLQPVIDFLVLKDNPLRKSASEKPFNGTRRGERHNEQPCGDLELIVVIVSTGGERRNTILGKS